MNKLNKILLGFLFTCAVVIPFREVKAISWVDTSNFINYVYGGSYGTPSVTVPPISYSSTNGGTFTVDPGFIISSYSGCSDSSHPELCSTSYTNHVINGVGDTKALYLSTGDVFNVFWQEDGQSYPVNYSITGQGAAYPPVCSGGRVTNVTCVPESSDWTTETCPYQTGSQGFICPGKDSSLKVVFKEVIPGEVTVYGKDNDGAEHTDSMTVQSATNGEKNVEIYWVSSNVKNCYCTYNGERGDCGFGVSPTPNELVFANGPLSNGGFSLTSDKTFTVVCD